MRLNIDLGELADEPDELYALADQANLACGGHVRTAPCTRPPIRTPCWPAC
jgi:hypothetical protein